MFQLDDKFLQDLGLNDMPEDQKKEFLDHIYAQLELRVGTRLSDGLTDAQLNEFESFIDRDEDKVRAWIAANAPNYADDPAFQQIKGSAPEATNDVALMAEYASLRWLATNRPDYRDVVKRVLEDIKQEILSNRDAILGSDQAA